LAQVDKDVAIRRNRPQKLRELLDRWGRQPLLIARVRISGLCAEALGHVRQRQATLLTLPPQEQTDHRSRVGCDFEAGSVYFQDAHGEVGLMDHRLKPIGDHGERLGSRSALTHCRKQRDLGKPLLAVTSQPTRKPHGSSFSARPCQNRQRQLFVDFSMTRNGFRMLAAPPQIMLGTVPLESPTERGKAPL
jgi:hypothetical protein